MRVWTDEQRQKQREAIRKWAPWKGSTGPVTVAGKKISCMNALKHGGRCAGIRRLATISAIYSRQHKFMKGYIMLAQRQANRGFAILRDEANHRISSKRANELLRALPPPPSWESYLRGVFG